MTRIFEHGRVWRLDQAAFEAAAGLLADAIIPTAGRVDAVVGVARGGCALAEALSAALAVPAVTIRARHNPTDAAFSQGQGWVDLDPVEFDPPAPGARLLVADDICGTGATLDTVRGYLSTAASAARVFTCALCRNEGSRFSPDVWVWEVRDWVTFPWEQP
ncbi:MAG: phosphoribosyltransferase, partial [Egibacteraceae bacterium]